MKRLSFLALGLSAVVVLSGCGLLPASGGGWVTLIDGNAGLDNFNRIGDANWRAGGGAIVADKGAASYLVTKKSYKDVELRSRSS